MQHYVGVDCAHKSLGISYITFDPTRYSKINEVLKELKEELDLKKIDFMLQQIITHLDNIINVRHVEVINLLGDKHIKDLNFVERTGLLKTALEQVDKNIGLYFAPLSKPPTILVEYQMSANFKSHDIYSSIIFHFVNRCPVISIGPSLKQTIAFTKEGRYEHFIKKYSSNYAANKKHSAFNLTKWLAVFNKMNMIKGIKKLDDVGDAVLMSISFIFKNDR